MTSTLQEETESPEVSIENEEKSSYSPSPYRFIRCNPRFDQIESIAELTAELNRKPFPILVPWLEGYYAIPSTFSLQKSKSFQSARIYGQDVSSGAAVAALLSTRHDVDPSQIGIDTSVEGNQTSFRILDLCCCPGLKLCAIADTLYENQKCADLVGVDISESRMAVCKRILRKYQIQPFLNPTMSDEGNVRHNDIRLKLFCNDGTKLGTIDRNDLNLIFDSTVSYEDEVSMMGKRKRMNKSARARETKRLKQATIDLGSSAELNPKLETFDRVIVDAECGTDGSVVHLHKRLRRAKSTLRPDTSRVDSIQNDAETDTGDATCVFNDDQLVELYALQRDLASAGYQLLRKGGIMIYSTCSLSDLQNGAIVQWLLHTYPDARIVPVDFFPKSHSSDPIDYSDMIQQGSVPGTIQFLPNMDEVSVSADNKRLFGGGFYIAKIKKVE